MVQILQTPQADKTMNHLQSNVKCCLSFGSYNVRVLTKCDSHAFYDSAMPMIFHLAFKMQVPSSFGQSIKDDNIF